jgi:regulator of nucleoside diphosphate kinase
MNSYIAIIIVLGLYTAGALLIILIGRLLMRTGVHRRGAAERRTNYPISRVTEDLRPVQQTMIDFIDAFPSSRELLRRLAQTNEPIPVGTLVANIPANEGNWTALLLISLAGLVTLKPQGALMTCVGREFLAPLNGDTTRRAPQTFQIIDAESEVSKNTGHGNHASPNSQLEVADRSRLAPARSVVALHTGQQRETRIPLATNNGQHKSPAIVTAADYHELTSAIVAARKLAVLEPGTRMLQEKLAHAVIGGRSDLPPDVITMYTRAEVTDVDTGERLNLMLVFPIDADVEQERVSVFDPLGAAMLGRRAGDQIRWDVPYGVRRFEIKAVHFQPETALAQAA